MNSGFPRRDTREHARMEAARQLLRLGVDKNQPVDIFKIIQDSGIWLMFQPLGNLYGAYIHQDEATGIIIHSKHPLSLQRFTAAHEYAHFSLGHTLSLDGQGLIERAGNSSDPREVAADTFAANFLMPLQLVNVMLGRMGLPRNPDQLTDVQAYQLSLDMGVSYTAAINRLVSLRKITPVQGEQLRKPPKMIKAQIAGAPIDNSWADIWPLDETNTGKLLNLRVYDELSICLRETPSTGYVWTVDGTIVTDVSNKQIYAHPDKGLASQQRSLFDISKEESVPVDEGAPLGLVSNDFELNTSPDGQARLGSTGNRYMRLRSLRPGRYTLRLLKRRPWQLTVPPAEVFEVHLNVSDKAHGVSAQQQRGLAVAA